MVGATEPEADGATARKLADAKLPSAPAVTDGQVPVDREDAGEEGEEEAAAAVEEIVIRVEPLPQQSAAPADVERGLRLIALCREHGADDVERVRQLVREGAPAGFVTTSGWTPVAAAASVGNVNVLLYLLELGADGMYSTSRRSAGDSSVGGDAPASPLANRRMSSVSALIALGDADAAAASALAPSARSVNTPLHWASYGGHADAVALLLQAGYSLEEHDPEGNQALHLAAAGGHREALELLLAHAAPADTRNRFGNCPEDLAATADCRRVLARVRATRACQRCKESFSRIRRPSLCQRCAGVYCDTKPCTSTAGAPIHSVRLEGASVAPRRTLRFCQECAAEMHQAEQELRAVLESKQALIRRAVELLAAVDGRSSLPASSSSALDATAGDGGPEGAEKEAARGDVEAHEGGDQPEDAGAGAADATTAGDAADEASSEPPTAAAATGSRSGVASDAAVLRALSLAQTDAEALYTALEAARAKAAAALDASLLEDARRTYLRLVAHVALQEEIKGLVLVRPVGTRSLLAPLKRALLAAAREHVPDELLALARRVVRGAEAECTLFGAHALCEARVPVGGKAHARDIARLDASLRAAAALGASDKLLAQAGALLARLGAEVRLEASLVAFRCVGGSVDAASYVFPDGSAVDSLLQALERRAHQVSAAMEAGAAVEGVSAALMDQCGALLKQLKKDVREETKNEEERRRLEEEAALKAAKKGKKKKA